MLNAFLYLGKRAAIGAGEIAGILATPPVLTVGLGRLGVLGFTAKGVAAGKFTTFDPLVI